MRRVLPILSLLLLTFAVCGQTLSLTFTSKTEAKFFVYLNGRLQNEKSKGMLTISNLEDKDYHVRIVIDDPYEVAYTQTFHPSAKHNSYTVEFNPVRERVIVREAKAEVDEEATQEEGERIPPSPAAEQRKKARPDAVRLNGQRPNTSQVNSVRTKTVLEK